MSRAVVEDSGASVAFQALYKEVYTEVAVEEEE